ELGLSHLDLDLARLDVHLAILQVGASFAGGRVGRRWLDAGLDDRGPAALQRRARALVDGRVAVQLRAGVVALGVPEERGALVRRARPPEAHPGGVVASR